MEQNLPLLFLKIVLHFAVLGAVLDVGGDVVLDVVGDVVLDVVFFSLVPHNQSVDQNLNLYHYPIFLCSQPVVFQLYQ